MPRLSRPLLSTILFLSLGTNARAAVQLSMTVDGPRGTFASGNPATSNAMKLASAQVDFAAGASAPMSTAKPVIVVRRTDPISWQFLESLAAGDVLRVVISISEVDRTTTIKHRRTVSLSGARVLWIHSGMDATSDDEVTGLGVETIAFTYERIDVEDDGVKVFTAGA